jgi:hypothetical protein
MAHLLIRSPIPDQPSVVYVRDELVRVRANQIIAWATLTVWPVDSPNPTARPFPVIVDTGHTHSLSIQTRQLAEWAGIDPETLPLAGRVRESGRHVALRRCNIWLHPNQRGARDQLANRTPVLVGTDRGIAVYPTGVEFPRLPILGLRAITGNRLVLIINGHRREATLRTAYRWWPFAGR